jgi:hypothetical protein
MIFKFFRVNEFIARSFPELWLWTKRPPVFGRDVLIDIPLSRKEALYFPVEVGYR